VAGDWLNKGEFEPTIALVATGCMQGAAMTMKMIVVGIGALLMANPAVHAAAKCTSVQSRSAADAIQ
jgi:hypothetical protein